MHKIFLLLIFLLLNTPAFAQDNINLESWSKLPVLHDGRVKPIDSFARVHLKKFSNKEKFEKESAAGWLAQTLFSPESAANNRIFKIRDFDKYGLTERDNKLYSYVEVVPALEKQKDVIGTLLQSDPEKWTPAQQELIDLHGNFSTYAQLLRSMTGILPLDIEGNDASIYLMLKDKKSISEIEKNIMTLIEAGGKNNSYLKILPSDWNNLKDEWHSIWDELSQEKTNNQNLDYIKNWAKLALAYRDDSPDLWQEAMLELPAELKTARLHTEYIYNIVKLLTLAATLYFISFVFVILGNVFQKRAFEKTAFYILSFGLLANILDIILRVYILSRPPVGTLYESIIFVSVICVSGFLLIEKKQRNQTGLILGSISGVLLLTVARSFAGDDTMDTLVAVLNTNFWLLTHVICITIGYGVCFIAALIAHYYLILKIYRPDQQETLSRLSAATKTFVIISLLFTTIGTILGGIWADQSWGRFWGWDPKENGALLIVLWLIWLLHGTISKHINETGFIVGTAFLNIIVVLAWFGVNLLSVGLHSYGFISGVATSIAVFCIFETVLILGLWFFGRNKALS